jgi:hypothetical protein
MLGTYASFVVVFGASSLAGQAILAACGRREWSWLAPAVGLAALCPLAWWTVRLPGEGTAALVAIAAAAAAATLLLRGRVSWRSATVGDAPWVGLAALLLASLPFIIEARFGILGTGLNPDMSQHLFAADRLASGGSERLIADGYPLGPHSIVVAVSALGPSAVEAFNGLTLAVAVAACLAPLALFDMRGAWRRTAGALCIGLTYLVAAYLVQGAFKETMQALFVLAFAIALRHLARGRAPGESRAPGALEAMPLAVLAIGSVYVYSFPGLAWLIGALAVWAAFELGRAAPRRPFAEALRLARRAAPTALITLLVLVVAIAPEAGRIADFADFETFDPDGEGLGNLFDRLSPLEALGIWPSGDFRVEPGDGAVPAVAFYLGAAFGLAALGFGLAWWWRRGEGAVPAALVAAALLWLYSLVAGTPYQEAKALVLASPLVALVTIRALGAAAPALVAAAFLLAAGGSSVLALVNGPVGPSGYSPALAELRSQLGPRSTVVFAPGELLDEQHGRDYLAWELRGNRICVEELPADGPARAPAGAGALTVSLEDGAVVPEALQRAARPPDAEEPCPLIPDRARADPSAGANG